VYFIRASFCTSILLLFFSSIFELLCLTGHSRSSNPRCFFSARAAYDLITTFSIATESEIDLDGDFYTLIDSRGDFKSGEWGYFDLTVLMVLIPSLILSSMQISCQSSVFADEEDMLLWSNECSSLSCTSITSPFFSS
jgi:hypothetical protein